MCIMHFISWPWASRRQCTPSCCSWVGWDGLIRHDVGSWSRWRRHWPSTLSSCHWDGPSHFWCTPSSPDICGWPVCRPDPRPWCSQTPCSCYSGVLAVLHVHAKSVELWWMLRHFILLLALEIEDHIWFVSEQNSSER